MTDGIVIQARSGSTRMPAKILLPFDGERTVLDIILSNIIKSNPGRKVIVATTTSEADDRIEAAARAAGAECFRGDEENVLSRFTGAADRFGVDRVVRVCSDNPFLLAGSFGALFEEADRHPEADYVAFAFPDGRPTIKSHLGLYAEFATADALRRAEAMADAEPDPALRKLWREHVTICLYTHPGDFALRFLPLPEVLRERQDLRLTLDTPSDFSLLQELYGKMRGIDESSGDGRLEALVKLIDSNPAYGRIMKQNIASNEK